MPLFDENGKYLPLGNGKVKGYVSRQMINCVLQDKLVTEKFCAKLCKKDCNHRL